jgi:quercetin dioxygenase-like cupin family protein
MKIAMAILVAGAVPNTAGAEAPYPPLKRVPTMESRVPASNPPIRLVRGATITFAPGQLSGLHRHPVSTVGVVTTGSFIFEPQGAPRRVLHVGETFFEPANRTIVRFDNASSSKPAEITVFYLTDKASRPLIEMLGDQSVARHRLRPQARLPRHVFLMAVHEAEARIYRRIGFVPFATMLHVARAGRSVTTERDC